MGSYGSSKFMGPCWSRERGYHQPAPLPSHIMQIITAPSGTRQPKENEMGNWNININGTGAHHNADNPGDANKRFHEFVQKLKEDGHSIQAATFTSGSSEVAKAE